MRLEKMADFHKGHAQRLPFGGRTKAPVPGILGCSPPIQNIRVHPRGLYDGLGISLRKEQYFCLKKWFEGGGSLILTSSSQRDCAKLDDTVLSRCTPG